VLLGIIPGAGGTQRLPRLAGAELALTMCTDGKPVAAPKAKSAGMVDAIIDGDLLLGAVAFAKAKAASRETRQSPRHSRLAPMRSAPASKRAGKCASRSPRPRAG
jgi:3-hydroxyacyl-CoA dehydrogenase